jgi:site-specific DNA-methyltransferase (adenine-specific)
MRWPANLIHDGSPEVCRIFPETNSGNSTEKIPKNGKGTNGIYGDYGDKLHNTPLYPDSGNASRYFYCAKASRADRDDGLAAFAQRTAGEMTDRTDGSAGTQSPRAGAGRTHGGRNVHPTVKPTSLMAYLCRLVTPVGGTVLDPFTGSGSTGRGAIMEGFNFIGIELSEEYAEIARARIAAAAALPKQAQLFEEDQA